MAPELTTVDDMAAPRVGERATADKIDAPLPPLEQLEIGLESVQCFT